MMYQFYPSQPTRDKVENSPLNAKPSLFSSNLQPLLTSSIHNTLTWVPYCCHISVSARDRMAGLLSLPLVKLNDKTIDLLIYYRHNVNMYIIINIMIWKSGPPAAKWTPLTQS